MRTKGSRRSVGCRAVSFGVARWAESIAGIAHLEPSGGCRSLATQGGHPRPPLPARCATGRKAATSADTSGSWRPAAAYAPRRRRLDGNVPPDTMLYREHYGSPRFPVPYACPIGPRGRKGPGRLARRCWRCADRGRPQVCTGTRHRVDVWLRWQPAETTMSSDQDEGRAVGMTDDAGETGSDLVRELARQQIDVARRQMALYLTTQDRTHLDEAIMAAEAAIELVRQIRPPELITYLRTAERGTYQPLATRPAERRPGCDSQPLRADRRSSGEEPGEDAVHHMVIAQAHQDRFEERGDRADLTKQSAAGAWPSMPPAQTIPASKCAGRLSPKPSWHSSASRRAVQAVLDLELPGGDDDARNLQVRAGASMMRYRTGGLRGRGPGGRVCWRGRKRWLATPGRQRRPTGCSATSPCSAPSAGECGRSR